VTVFVSRAKLLLFLRHLVKIRFFSPDRYRFVVFEKVGSEYLMPLLEGESTVVLHFPPKTIHITPLIVLNTLLNLLRGFVPVTSYLRALITQIDPEMVLTFIDNSARFSNLAYSNHQARRYLAIQNGARYDLLENNACKKFFFHSEFACFGKNEENLHRQASSTVLKFHFIGSLREAHYRRYQQERNISILPQNKQYDICVVSEASPGWDDKYPGMELGIGRIAQFAVRLAEEFDLKIVIAGKRDDNPSEVRVADHSAEVESQWYKHYISDKVKVTPRHKNEYSTYKLVSNSAISIGCVSTALYEGASRGSRVG
jgi:surface carbohydrate biosynthesis protein